MRANNKSSDDQNAVDGRSKRRVDNGQRLLDAAIELMEDKPYQEISVEDICEAASVGRATFFRAFKSKSGLIVEYNRRLAERVKQRLEILDPPDAIQSLRILGAVFADYYASSSPGVANMITDHIRNADGDTDQDFSGGLIEVIADIVKQGAKEGSIHCELPSKLTAYVVLSHLGAAANYWFLHPGNDIQQMNKDALDGWLYGAANKRD